MNPSPRASQVESPIEPFLEADDGTMLRTHVVHAPSAKGWVIVVHGIDDHSGRYGALAQFLKERGYDAVLYDQRGHGESGGERNHVARFSQYVADLERVRAAMQPGRDSAPHVFAHSMGSVVALLAASRHPGHWRSIVVQGFPALPGRNIPKPLEILVRVARPLLGRLRVATGLDAEALSRDAAVAEAYRRDPHVKGKVTLGWVVEFAGALRELRRNVSTITCPILILHGESDTIARPAGSLWLAKNVGSIDRRLVTYPGLEHELHNELAEDRAKVFEEIGAWLDRR